MMERERCCCFGTDMRCEGVRIGTVALWWKQRLGRRGHGKRNRWVKLCVWYTLEFRRAVSQFEHLVEESRIW